MRQYILILTSISLALVGLFSCSDGDKIKLTDHTDTNIVGSWELRGVSCQVEVSNTLFEEEIERTITVEDTPREYLHLASNGAYWDTKLEEETLPSTSSAALAYLADGQFLEVSTSKYSRSGAGYNAQYVINDDNNLLIVFPTIDEYYLTDKFVKKIGLDPTKVSIKSIKIARVYDRIPSLID